MPPEVVAAISEAARHFVDLDELLEKAGEKIADLIGVEAAFVTSGAAAGLSIATAACMAGPDPRKAMQLPDTTGMKNEVIMLRCHRIPFDQAVRVAGAVIVDVGRIDGTSPEDISAAFGDRTAAIVYVAKAENLSGSVPLKELVATAKKSNIPVIVDAADELPPVSNLRKFTDMGADLTIFSGGKDLKGPQSSGIILGRKEWIRACASNSNPNHSIGRPMKADKEAIAGLTKAIELYLEQNFEAEMDTWEKQQNALIHRLSEIPLLSVCKTKPFPGQPGSFYLPAVCITIDEKRFGFTVDEVTEELRRGTPGIAVDRTQTSVIIRTHMLKEEETVILAERLKEIFASG
jgi:L-seryl-tRNA(Ser) seleniumtransferase